jgi:hypothetical protein
MIERPPEFKFVVVWEFATAKDQEERFRLFGQNILKARVLYLEDVPIIGFEGRTDVLFAVHEGDIWPFVYARVRFPMWWIEDALSKHPEWYPERLKAYRRY